MRAESRRQSRALFDLNWNHVHYGLRLFASLHVSTENHLSAPYIFLFGCFFVLASLSSVQGLNSLTRHRTPAPAVEVWGPNHWTSKDFPYCLYYFCSYT